jgi:hypothetical protein
MAYAYKKRLKYQASKIFSDKGLKNYDDWSIRYEPKESGYIERKVVITLIPKKEK